MYVQGENVCTRYVRGENVFTLHIRGVQNCTKWSRSRLIGRGVINALCLTGFFMDLIQKVNVYIFVWYPNLMKISGCPLARNFQVTSNNATMPSGMKAVVLCLGAITGPGLGVLSNFDFAKIHFGNQSLKAVGANKWNWKSTLLAENNIWCFQGSLQAICI